MRSKSRETREAQKAYWENRLSRRLSELSQKGLSPSEVAKDPALKKIRAEIRKAGSRLRAIAAREQKVAEMAEAKARKEALPGKKKGGKGKGEKAPEMSKRQQKKLKKRDQKGAK